MRVDVDFHSDVPVYKQIVEAVEDAILSSELKEGDELPSIRKLALDTNVNPNTVAKAYFVLQSKGFVYSVSGIGYKVTKPPVNSLKDRIADVEREIEEGVKKLAKFSMDKNEIEKRMRLIIERVMSNGGEDR